MTLPPEDGLKAVTDMDVENMSPPKAPLAMPRQVLERDAREGVLTGLLRLLFTRHAYRPRGER